VNLELAALALGQGYAQRHVLSAGSTYDDCVSAWIERQSGTQTRGTELDVVPSYFRAGWRIGGELNRESRHARCECGDLFLRGRQAGVVGMQQVDRISIGLERVSELPGLLVAVAEVDRGARRRVESLAFLELGARGLVFACCQEGTSLAKQRVGGGRVSRLSSSNPQARQEYESDGSYAGWMFQRYPDH
jgi:hypothetical protein